VSSLGTCLMTQYGCSSIRVFAVLLSGTLSRQSLLYSTLRARLQVEGVTLHFFNDVFRLNLALEPPQGILDRLTLLQSNFCQAVHPQTSTTCNILELTLFALSPAELIARHADSE